MTIRLNGCVNIVRVRLIILILFQLDVANLKKNFNFGQSDLYTLIVENQVFILS